MEPRIWHLVCGCGKVDQVVHVLAGNHAVKETHGEKGEMTYPQATYTVMIIPSRYGRCSKKRYQNGTLVSGSMDQNLRNPSCLIFSHTHMEVVLNSPRPFYGARSIWHISSLPAGRAWSRSGLARHPRLPSAFLPTKMTFDSGPDLAKLAHFTFMLQKIPVSLWTAADPSGRHRPGSKAGVWAGAFGRYLSWIVLQRSAKQIHPSGRVALF